MAVSLQWMFEAEDAARGEVSRITVARDGGLVVLCTAYLTLAAGLVAQGTDPPWSSVLTLACVPVVAAVTTALHLARGDRVSAMLRAAWPVLAAPEVYLAEVHLVELQPGRYHDQVLERIDAWLGLARAGHPVLPLGGPLEELANVLYASYWLIPVLLLAVAARYGPQGVARATSAMAFTTVACGILWLAFPTGGYHPTGSPQGAAFGPFTFLVHEIYAREPHFAAAFPSEHVGHAVALAAVLRRLGVGWWIWLWVAGIAASTVIGQYHFAADAVGGWALGLGGAALVAYLAEQRPLR